MHWPPVRKQLLRICKLLPPFGMIFLCLWAAGEEQAPYDPISMGFVGACCGLVHGCLAAALLRSIIYVVDCWKEPRSP